MDKIGRYEVVRQLGHGGMGQVFLAHDPTLDRDVAVKVLNRETVDTGLRDEARALAALSHPGIVTIFEIGEHAGQDFIAMEYLPGRSLREVLAAGAHREELLAICVKVAIAVSAAHRAGILHRDIKPENVVVTEAGDVKVVDFGLARRLQHQTRSTRRPVSPGEVVDAFTRTMPFANGTDTVISAGTQTMFGTPAYMAPEVLIGDPSSAASDIYSLGVVIYECLAGHRPYMASSLVEVIAQVIDGPPRHLDDPLGDLVSSMLAREPDRRPTLDDIARRLRTLTTRPRSVIALPAPRWPFVVAALVAAGGGIGAWLFTRRTPDPPAVVPSITASVAIAPMAVDIPSYGGEPPQPPIFADTLARLLGQVDGVHLTGITITPSTGSSGVDGDGLAAARALGAGYLATASIAEASGVLTARLELVAVATGARIASQTMQQPSPDHARLIDAIATTISTAIAAGAHLKPAPDAVRAQMFYRQGTPILEAGRFTEARPYFEQAVDADPTLFDGWYSLALVLGWMEVPEEQVQAAIDKALALARPGPKQELMRGVSLYLAGKYAEARATLEPLDGQTSSTDRRELLYYLGETNWHDGRHASGFGYFKRTLEADPRFRPATVHAWQYVVARRDAKQLPYFVGLAGGPTEWTDFALGNYAALAAAAPPPFKLNAQLVLGRRDSPELAAKLAGDDLDAWTYRIALAAAADHLSEARATFAQMWAHHIAGAQPAQLAGNTFYELEALGEVVISAGMADEARQLVTLLAECAKTRAVRGYARLSILTATLVGDRSLVVRDGLSERNARLAAASDAELAGDHAAAATMLGELVADPTFTWDYPERAALIRNLRALKRSKQVTAVCTDSLRPAVFRTAFLVLAHVCARRP